VKTLEWKGKVKSEIKNKKGKQGDRKKRYQKEESVRKHRKRDEQH
jgi:hypothetical protein